MVVRVVADEPALGEGAGPVDERILGDPRVVLDDVIDILLEEGLVVVVLSALQKAEDSLLQQRLHLSL